MTYLIIISGSECNGLLSIRLLIDPHTAEGKEELECAGTQMYGVFAFLGPVDMHKFVKLIPFPPHIFSSYCFLDELDGTCDSAI